MEHKVIIVEDGKVTMNRKIQAAILTGCILGITGLSAAPAIADELPGGNTPAATHVNSFVVSVDSQFLNVADGFVSLTNGIYVFDEAVASTALPADQIRVVRDLVASVNEQLRHAYTASTARVVVSAADKLVTVTNVGAPTSGEVTPFFTEGVTKVEAHWWGISVYLSKTTVQAIGGGIAIGGIWIPEPVVSKVLATLGVVVALCPGGIAFDWYAPPAGPIVNQRFQ
jgi:hypothetical protein